MCDQQFKDLFESGELRLCESPKCDEVFIPVQAKRYCSTKCCTVARNLRNKGVKREAVDKIRNCVVCDTEFEYSNNVLHNKIINNIFNTTRYCIHRNINNRYN